MCAEETLDFAAWPASVFEKARERVAKAGIDQTPLRKSLWLSKELQAEVYLKFENLHEGGSFKVRGAFHYLYCFKEKHGSFPSQVITASGGNHGMAVAVACFQLNIPCTVIIPSNSITDNKRKLLSAYNVNLVIEGSCWQESNQIGLDMLNSLDNTEKACYIHPFLHPWVIQGASTMAAEIVDKAADVEIIIASLGGGGMIAGIISFLRSNEKYSNIQVGSAETSGADYYYQSVQQGKLVLLDKITSIASTLGASTGSQETYELFLENIKYPMVVSDAEAVAALWQILEHERILVEPSCSASVAALLKYKEQFKGKKIALVMCGGNVSLPECLQWQQKFLFPEAN
eukprot:CAMPEP_0206192304 /NCGR_PEP_ID=MMETSP0166-20121206/5879_1 /ASSEMBLY_ACC=CAM_ASM_000260 /TAXON_ID=95228 /ORGANISM="Vannella robusta, Strain DIVA3 518/3/11/1/6" /LENGTH=344 /DNA_ID=CAMNT_0053608775 /DNA_START=741 /DNA_END=1775 /DNA_ORIENTATION=-